jgi:hypothetical protein
MCATWMSGISPAIGTRTAWGTDSART